MKQLHLKAAHLLLGIAILLTTTPSMAQRNGNFTMLNIKQYVVRSNFNNKTYELDVSLPKNYSSTDTVHYPVLYVLDGQYNFTSFYSINVVVVQSALAKVRSNKLNFLRISVLLIPTFLSFPVVVSKAIIDLGITSHWHFDIIGQTNAPWWTAQLISFVVCIPVGIWFYRMISYRHLHKKWVNKLIEKASGRRVKKAMEYLRELEGLKHDHML